MILLEALQNLFQQVVEWLHDAEIFAHGLGVQRDYKRNIDQM